MARDKRSHKPMSSWSSSRNRYVKPGVTVISLKSDHKFQSEAWHTTHAILQSPESSDEAKLFAATTLKGKVGQLSVPLSGLALMFSTDHIRSPSTARAGIGPPSRFRDFLIADL